MLKRVLFTVFCCTVLNVVIGQQTPIIAFSGGLVSYYFWEENEEGEIISTIKKPFFKNHLILRNTSKGKQSTNIQFNEMISGIHAVAESNAFQSNKKFRFKDSLSKKHSYFFEREKAFNTSSIIFYKNNGEWFSKETKTVNYFEILPDGKMRYLGAKDSLLLPTLSIRQKCTSPITVYQFFNENRTINFERVLAYSGEDITQQLASQTKVKALRFALFFNGYRGPNKEKDPSDNLVTQNDRFGYWFKIDNRFAERLKPNYSYFLDASFSIKTSVHKTKWRFLKSWFRTQNSLGNQRIMNNRDKLNFIVDSAGFNYRIEEGKFAARAFMNATSLLPCEKNGKDTLDIICHSMGYAYSLGFVEELKQNYIFGNMYIIAPENASVASPPFQLFKEVWQYGTNAENEKGENIDKQDGVAPQVAVKNIENQSSAFNGRVYFPENWPNKNFIHSHMMYSYDWIFDCLAKGEKGSVFRN